MHTLSKMAESGSNFNPQVVKEKELMPGARGARSDANIRVHSLRLPGLISHQEVLFGGAGETLTIRHDSLSRESFAAGIAAATRFVSSQNGLIVGLDSVLEMHGAQGQAPYDAKPTVS